MTRTPEAQRALSDACLTRRDFMRTSGALIVSFGAAQLLGGCAPAAPSAAAQGARAASGALDSWIAIGADGMVTAYTGKCELGQGLHTAQVQLIAEELCVPISQVRLVQCDTAVSPDQGTTSGSQSHPTNFNQANLALAGATAREALVRLAAERLSVPADGLSVADGRVAVSEDPSRRVSYGDLVNGRTFDLPLDPDARRRPHQQWTVLGTSVPRVDMPALVTGRLEYVHNVRVPGMLHGCVVRPASVGATVVSVDNASVAGLAGLVQVVVRGNFVGVVAEKPWQAIQASRMLEVSWSPGPPLPSHAGFYDHLRQAPARDGVVVDSGDVDARLGASETVVEATYRHPYQMHGSIGSSCAVADVQGSVATIWAASQAVFALRSTTAQVLAVPIEQVHVVFTRGAGCYGLNGADTVALDAALLSQAVGRPVRVQLSRADEMAWENYGYAYVIDQRAGVDGEGAIVAWDHESWYATRGGRPGYDRPGNVVTGMLAGFEPSEVEPQSPAPAPTRFNNGSNAAPSYVTGRVGGQAAGTGTVASERVRTHTIRSPFFTGPLRSPSRLQNTFAHESFIDEIAAHVGADPVQYRLRHLRDQRLIDVLTAVAKAADWQARPSPHQGQPRAGVARGRGCACLLYEGDNGYCAMVAEVEVDQDTGRIRATRIVASQDCGPISTPDGMKNQIEGGALQGLSRVLGEEVTWDDNKVTSIDWRTYHSLTLGADMPPIESVLIDRPDQAAMGAGETTVTLTAAAIGNAVFDATGARLREVPFTPERVSAALASR